MRVSKNFDRLMSSMTDAAMETGITACEHGQRSGGLAANYGRTKLRKTFALGLHRLWIPPALKASVNRSLAVIPVSVAAVLHA